MTKKYTDEQIIAYLRTLREGDVLTAVKDDYGYITTGERYIIKKGVTDDLLITDDKGYTEFVRLDNKHNRGIANYIRLGIFEIPTQAKSFYIEIVQTVASGGNSHRVTIDADSEGLSKLRALESESKKATELAELYEQRDAIQSKINELEAV